MISRSMLRSKLQNICMVAISLVFAIYLAELILRYFYVLPQPLAMYYPMGPEVANAHLVIDQKEFVVDYDFNINGFRGESIKIDKQDREIRFLFVGDSLVEGFGVEEEQRFSNFLLRILNQQAHDAKYTGINIAQLATNPISYLDNITRFGIALKPDIVIVGIFLGNDFQGGRGMASIVGTPQVNDRVEIFDSMNRPADIGWFRLGYVRIMVNQLFAERQLLFLRINHDRFWEAFFHSEIDTKLFMRMLDIDDEEWGKLIRKAPSELINDAMAGRINPGYLVQALRMLDGREDFSSPERYYNDDDIGNTLSAIGAISEVCQNNSIDLLVVIIPSVYEVDPDRSTKVLKEYFGYDQIPKQIKEQAILHEELVNYLDGKKIAYYDTMHDLRASARPTFYLYDQHMNGLGHEVVAKGISRILATR